MTRTSRLFIVSLVAASAFVACFPQLSPGQMTYRQTPYPPPVDISASSAARRGAEQAQADLRRAQRDFGLTATEVQIAAQATPQFQDAMAALRKVEAEYADARSRVSSALGATDAYQWAKAEKDRLQQHVTADQTSGAEAGHLRQSAEEKLVAARTLSALEAAAFAADAECERLKPQLLDAAQRVAQFRAQFEARLRDDPKWQSARGQVSSARESVQRATEALARARDKEMQAEWERQVKIAQIERQRAERVSHGGRGWGRRYVRLPGRH